MRDLLVTTFLSLDGVMQAPGGPDEDPSGDFALGGWSFHYFDDEVGAEMEQLMAEPFDLLLGRRTYDIFAGFWPSAPADENSIPLNRATKYVASRGTPELTWDTSVLLTGDARRGGHRPQADRGSSSSRCTAAVTSSRRCSRPVWWIAGTW